MSLLLNFVNYKKPENVNYKTIFTEDELNDLVKRTAEASEVSVDTETTSVSPTRANLVGISLSFKKILIFMYSLLC